MPNGTGLTARKVSKSRELHEPIRHILAVGIKPGTARGSPRLAHSEGIAYKPPCGEIAMCLRAGLMGPDK